MARIDRRINLSFKNTQQEIELYEFVNKEGEIIGVSSYIKQLIYRDILDKKKKSLKD
ncbi:MAG: hypothetical protein ACRC7S_18535 [Cetobacterium sp.]